MIDITGSETFDLFFPRIPNFQQHPIRMAIYNESGIWTFTYDKNNQDIGGPDGKLWKLVFQVLNASFTAEISNNGSKINLNKIDVVPELGRICKFSSRCVSYENR